MGVYDDYGNANFWVQLKVGPCELHEYRVGDAVDITDGVYLDHAGVVVVLEGRLAAVFSHLWSKWGDVIDPASVIGAMNPVAQAVKMLEEQMGGTE